MNLRQTIVALAVKGRCTSKPRPWVVIQNDDFLATGSVILCALTHELLPNVSLLRVDVVPSSENGLRLPSQIQVGMIVTVHRGDLGPRIGRLEDRYMLRLGQAARNFMAF